EADPAWPCRIRRTPRDEKGRLLGARASRYRWRIRRKHGLRGHAGVRTSVRLPSHHAKRTEVRTPACLRFLGCKNSPAVSSRPHVGSEAGGTPALPGTALHAQQPFLIRPWPLQIVHCGGRIMSEDCSCTFVPSVLANCLRG